jgi:xanthine dehydrogenase large subunit
MMLTGKRHPFLAQFEAGFDDEGRLQAPSAFPMAAGASTCPKPYSGAPCFTWTTHTTFRRSRSRASSARPIRPQTAFRGFGGPQGMLVIEDILTASRTLCLPPETVRQRNFYREGHTTHYGQPVQRADRIERIWEELKQSSILPRAVAVDRFNHSHPHYSGAASPSRRSSSESRSPRPSSIRPAHRS